MATKQKSASKAFTLVEILIIIGVIAVAGSAGYVVATNVQENARESKLESDTAALNSALQMYKANGGVIAPTDTASQIVTKLKSSANQSTGSKSIGLKGNFLDTRISPVAQDASEADTSQARVLWNSQQGRFVVAKEGAAGFKRFDLVDAQAAEGPVASNERQNNLKVAVQDKWVWDYEDHDVPNEGMGPSPSVTPRSDYADPDDRTRTRLSPPIVTDLQRNENVLANFTKTGTLSNPNVPGTSQVYYQLESSGTTGAYRLYQGETFTLNPNDQVVAYAETIDPDRWDRSENANGDYGIDPEDLELSIGGPTSLTYAQAGGAMLSGGVQAVPNAVIALPAVGGHYFNDSEIKVTYATSRGVSGTAASFNGSFPSIPISLGAPDAWTSNSVTINAQAVPKNTEYFTGKSVTQTVNIARTTLSLTFTTPSTTLSATDKILISPASAAAFPADYKIFYTTDGSEPNRNATDYPEDGLSLPSGSTNITIKARAYPDDEADEKWFDSIVNSNGPYTVPVASSALPGGVLVSFAELQNNVQLQGSVTIAYTGTPTAITLFGNSKVRGNVYVPGTPDVYKDHIAASQWDFQKWTPATDGNFANYILGKQFSGTGTLITPQTEPVSPRVIDIADGDPEPSTANFPNYTILIQDSAKIEGKLYRRSVKMTLPTVNFDGLNLPAGPARAYNSWTLSPSNPSHYSDVVESGTFYNKNNLTSLSLTTNSTLTLKSGDYGNVVASQNGRLVLGDASNPDNVQYYTFQSLSVNGGAAIDIVGKVVITINYDKGGSNTRIDNNSYIGNAAHPEYLQLNVYSTSTPNQFNQQFLVASGGKFYGRVNAPKGLVTIQENAVFRGAVTAYKLQMTGSAGADILFNLAPTS